MIADRFPIVEYDTTPVCRNDAATGGYIFDWQGRRSVDLRWVASATPWETHFTEITLCGAGAAASVLIRCPYSDFMRDWARAKGV